MVQRIDERLVRDKYGISFSAGLSIVRAFQR